MRTGLGRWKRQEAGGGGVRSHGPHARGGRGKTRGYATSRGRTRGGREWCRGSSLEGEVQRFESRGSGAEVRVSVETGSGPRVGAGEGKGPGIKRGREKKEMKRKEFGRNKALAPHEIFAYGSVAPRTRIQEQSLRHLKCPSFPTRAQNFTCWTTATRAHA